MLLARMLETGILVSSEGRLLLGPKGEALYARKNFQALYAVFEAPPLLRVQWGPREVGSVDALFLQALPPGSCFVLGGARGKSRTSTGRRGCATWHRPRTEST